MKTSSGAARSTCGGKHTQLAITSRWKCIVAFGWPVVPEVKASRQVSVGGGVDVGERRVVARHARFQAVGGAGIAEVDDVVEPRRGGGALGTAAAAVAAASSSARSATSQSAIVTCAFSMIWPSSLARSIGIVATAMPPAFITANQHATSIGLLAARSSTRLPGTRPHSATSTWAMRSACRCSSAYVHAGPPGALTQRRSPRPSLTWRSSSSVAQFSRSGNCSSGRSKRNSGCASGGGRWSRAKVSTWAVYGMVGAPRVQASRRLRTPRSR